jgi:hypothetical protein
MRELGFSVMWSKLLQPGFTTFRFPRKDRDWQCGELARVVYHPRHKDRKVLGVAHIIAKEQRLLMGKSADIPTIDTQEAVADGFISLSEMLGWIAKTYREIPAEPMNKLTLIWTEKQ